MAKVVKEFPVGTANNEEFNKYLDGQIWLLDKKDTDGRSLHGFYQILYYRAGRMGKKLKSKINTKDNTLYIQALPIVSSK